MNYRDTSYQAEARTYAAADAAADPIEALVRYAGELVTLREHRARLSQEVAEMEKRSIELENAILETIHSSRGRDSRIDVIYQAFIKLRESTPMDERSR